MCGITGILGFGNSPQDRLDKMNIASFSRGPDGEGTYLDNKFPVILGHRRLSIQDLSHAGAQPMESHSGRYVISFNGEIYNAPDIRKSLEAVGICGFRGHSDTEILLESLEYSGLEKTLKEIRGMWAFALFDRQNGRVVLCRDRFGEKPLYYYDNNGIIAFASDIKSIKAYGDSLRLQKQVLELFFLYGYIPAPYTIYENVYKLLPGQYLVLEPDDFGHYRITSREKYYDLLKLYPALENTFSGSEQEAMEELEKLLRESVRQQMISDVPLGAFLSGGIDSTLIVSILQSISERPVNTFTIGFENKKYNEAEFAAETAAYLSTNHREMTVGFEEVKSVIDNLPKAFGEPFGDSSAIPTMLVSRMARENVTVALSGDGGDELFCGYNTYRDGEKSLGVMKGKLPFISGNLRRSLGNGILKGPIGRIPVMNTVGRCLYVRDLEDFYRLVRDDDPRIHRLPLMRCSYNTYISEYRNGFLKEPLNNLMLLDMLQYLPEDILTKVDRSAMAYSLETRIPLLGSDVVEFAMSLPLDYKLEGDNTKLILRKLLNKYVPEEMMDRPKKGFSVPLSKWLAGPELKDWAQDILSTCHSRAAEYIDVALLEKMWKDFCGNPDKYSVLIWYGLVLEQWLLDN